MKMKPIVQAIGLVVLTTVAVAAMRSRSSGPPSWTFFDMAEGALTIPDGATPEDFENSAKNLAFGTSYPTSIVPGDPQGKVLITVTGVALPTGEKQIVVNLQDESPDMVEARLYVNGVLKKTATRDNGRIVDSAGQAIATMTTYINLNTVAGIDVKWTDGTGYERYYDLGL